LLTQYGAGELMSQTLLHPMESLFVERRGAHSSHEGRERRQFVDGHTELSGPARELAIAVDGYKLQHRRRFISHEELLTVIQALGYHK
jgi:hypothetical protein